MRTSSIDRWADDGGHIPLGNARQTPPDAVPRRAERLEFAVRGTPVADEQLVLLDGGDEAYPRMLRAIDTATRSVYLETYAFQIDDVGARFVAALQAAAGRGVQVSVVIDGWGSARHGLAVRDALREAGVSVHIYNRLRALLLGRFGRNHRKILLVDEKIAFIGGLNIGDENLDRRSEPGWADLTLEIHGPQCLRLGQMLRGERPETVASAMTIDLCGLAGGWRLRRRYIKAFAGVRSRLYIAHGYFLPDKGIIRAISAAARRGVDVRLLLAGSSDVPFAQIATRRLYRRLLAAGVEIHEWDESVLHAKVAAIDGRSLLVGSFNLDPFSLANQETLVEVFDDAVVGRAERWIGDRLQRSPAMTSVDANSRLRRWFLDPLGDIVARIVVRIGRLLGQPT